MYAKDYFSLISHSFLRIFLCVTWFHCKLHRKYRPDSVCTDSIALESFGKVVHYIGFVMQWHSNKIVNSRIWKDSQRYGRNFIIHKRRKINYVKLVLAGVYQPMQCVPWEVMLIGNIPSGQESTDNKFGNIADFSVAIEVFSFY